MVERDLNKMFRKYMTIKDIPLKAISKKRGKNFGFLQFENADQKNQFKELFYSEVVPQTKKLTLKEVNKKVDTKQFRPCMDEEEMRI